MLRRPPLTPPPSDRGSIGTGPSAAMAAAAPRRAAGAVARGLGLVAGGVALLGGAGTVWADPSELPPSFNYNYGEAENARVIAMGSALSAFGNGTAAPFVNPANLTLTRVYHFEAIAQFTPEGRRQVYGGSVVDSTRRFAGGVGVMGGFIDPDGVNRSYLDVRLALAFQVADELSVGLGGRFLNMEQQGLGPLGDSLASGGRKDAEDPPVGRKPILSVPTLDAGVSLRPTEGLNIGLVGKNLTYSNNAFLPTIVGGGIGYGDEDLTLEADALADLNSYLKPTARVGAGGEYLIADAVPVRIGYRFDQGAASHALTAGVGYVHTAFSAELGLRRTLVGPSATSIVLNIAYHLESSGLTEIEEF
ncbi:MAG: hypothetical protein IT373_20880 [Polyangiaceae bacterium]|nr:hypothetical protein [Polyangiaceae bacterium]